MEFTHGKHVPILSQQKPNTMYEPVIGVIMPFSLAASEHKPS